MSETPEKDRLIDRLFNDPRRKLLNFHVTWGPEAYKLSPEQRAARINHAFDQVDCGQAKRLDFSDSLREPQSLDDFLASQTPPVRQTGE